MIYSQVRPATLHTQGDLLLFFASLVCVCIYTVPRYILSVCTDKRDIRFRSEFLHNVTRRTARRPFLKLRGDSCLANSVCARAGAEAIRNAPPKKGSKTCFDHDCVFRNKTDKFFDGEHRKIHARIKEAKKIRVVGYIHTLCVCSCKC